MTDSKPKCIWLLLEGVTLGSAEVVRGYRMTENDAMGWLEDMRAGLLGISHSVEEIVPCVSGFKLEHNGFRWTAERVMEDQS